MNDEQPDLIAETDQTIETHKQLARLVSSYYWNLVDEGVELEDACVLASGYQHELFENGRAGI